MAWGLDASEYTSSSIPAQSIKSYKFCSILCAPLSASFFILIFSDAANRSERIRPLSYILLKIHHIMLIFFIHKRRCNHEIRTGLVVGNGDVINLGNP